MVRTYHQPSGVVCFVLFGFVLFGFVLSGFVLSKNSKVISARSDEIGEGPSAAFFVSWILEMKRLHIYGSPSTAVQHSVQGLWNFVVHFSMAFCLSVSANRPTMHPRRCAMCGGGGGVF